MASRRGGEARMQEVLESGISGKTRLCGLIGNPVGHTLSPLIHNTLAQLTGTDLVYVPLQVEDEDSLGEAVRGAYDLNLFGINVTVPYKSAVIPFLRDIDPSAEKIGAVNTLVRVDGGYKGYNTDCSGIGSALNANGVCFPADQTYGRNGLIRTDTVVMIGAGGAAKAACYMCGEKGVRRLIILNRTVEHAARLAETVQKDFPSMAVSSMPLSKAPEIRENGFLAIQCTKAGLTPKVNETPVADRAFFQKAAAVYDVIYNPEETLFLRLARQEGTPGWCGLDMLLQQGISAFKLWTGIKPGEEQVEKVREHLWTTLY